MCLFYDGYFTQDNKAYDTQVAIFPSHLLQGFDKKHWQGTIISDRSVCFTYLSPDKEEGYPGDVMVSALFTLNDDNGIEIHYSGMASKTTLLHLSNHTFFNLCKDPQKSQIFFMVKLILLYLIRWA